MPGLTQASSASARKGCRADGEGEDLYEEGCSTCVTSHEGGDDVKAVRARWADLSTDDELDQDVLDGSHSGNTPATAKAESESGWEVVPGKSRTERDGSKSAKPAIGAWASPHGSNSRCWAQVVSRPRPTANADGWGGGHRGGSKWRKASDQGSWAEQNAHQDKWSSEKNPEAKHGRTDRYSTQAADSWQTARYERGSRTRSWQNSYAEHGSWKSVDGDLGDGDNASGNTYDDDWTWKRSNSRGDRNAVGRGRFPERDVAVSWGRLRQGKQGPRFSSTGNAEVDDWMAKRMSAAANL